MRRRSIALALLVGVLGCGTRGVVVIGDEAQPDAGEQEGEHMGGGTDQGLGEPQAGERAP